MVGAAGPQIRAGWRPDLLFRNRLIGVPVEPPSVPLPESASEGQGGWGSKPTMPIWQRLPGLARPVAPAKGQAGAGRFVSAKSAKKLFGLSALTIFDKYAADCAVSVLLEED